MNDMTTLLDRTYADTLAAVNNARAGDEEAKWQLQKLSELQKQWMSEKQYELDRYRHECELRMKEVQMKEEKRNNIIKLVLEGAGIVVPVVTSSYWMAKGLTFEEKGAYTSRTAQWLSQHFRLFRK